MGRHQITITIDTDIPVPMAKTELKPATKQIYEKLKAGYSVFFKDYAEADRLRHYIKYRNGRGSYALRKIDNEGWRVWLVK